MNEESINTAINGLLAALRAGFREQQVNVDLIVDTIGGSTEAPCHGSWSCKASVHQVHSWYGQGSVPSEAIANCAKAVAAWCEDRLKAVSPIETVLIKLREASAVR